MSGLVIAFMSMDATMKLLALPVVLESSGALGFTGVDMARGPGNVLLVCTLLYAAPQTAMLGAILLTGYLGGAVATHVRLGSSVRLNVTITSAQVNSGPARYGDSPRRWLR